MWGGIGFVRILSTVTILSVSLVNSSVSFKPVLRFGYNPQSVGSDLGSAVLVPGTPNGGQIVQCIEAITTVFRALLETLHIVTLFKMACNGFT